MARLKRDEFMTKYQDILNSSDDLEFIEDISDSIDYDESEELSNLRSELESAKADYEEIKKRYKERFFEATEDKVPDIVQGEVEERDYIDIKEI